MNASGLRRYPADVARAFGHTPVEAALAAFLAATFSWALEIDTGDAFREWWEIALLVGLAGVAAWVATLLNALGDWTSRRRWMVTGVGVVGAAVLGAFFLRMDREAEVWRAAALTVAALLVALAAPALGRPRDEALLRYRRLNGRLLLRGVGAALYSAALFAGLALALAAVDNLFELDMRGTIYGHVFGWIAFAVGPWIVLGGLEDIVRPLDERRETAALIHRLSGWLIIPLLALYYCILYAYAVRILLLGELPQNLVSPLVTAAGVLAVVALTFYDRGSEPAPGAGARARGALRVTPLLFLPLAALGVHAILVRVGEYGWTEFRYLRVSLLAALAVAAAGAAWQTARRRPLAVHLVPVVVAAALALSVVGPWGALAVSRASQRARLVAGLDQAGLLRDGWAVAADTAGGGGREVPAEVHETIRSTGWYLTAHFGPGAVSPPVRPELVEDVAEARDLPTVLGLRWIEPAGLRTTRAGSLATGEPVPLDPGGSAIRVRLSPRRGPGGLEQGGAWLRDSTTLVVRTPDGPLLADLRPLLDWLARQGSPPAHGLAPGAATLPLTDGSGVDRGRLLILEAAGPGPDGEALVNLEGVALLAGR